MGTLRKKSTTRFGSLKGAAAGSQKRKYRHMGLSEQEYLQGGFKDESIKDRIPPHKEFNGSVLPCEATKLVGIIFDPIEFMLYTIDTDLLMRVWDFNSGKCLRSFLVETRDDQIASSNTFGGNDGNPRS
mmetsp:Transcript_4725/g.7129  ORF Transcript_4725/g.7129 Transcript_4725/m.7129 type:complete len:129 (-) Transcript_4725:33-419(-)|eukprot:CAMPEP_0170505674 /NCGR_PEP_ID=MMETSP0208-20121228/51803_1 /TAXON_ID=197538 /ORGANISM="Strombidium inclinatum, Strain S3" /LENGTH=128 /DNA_ID=CAMNT_0010786689 /DNA_START=115 /DNA_END=501 /DNA_ORIENTATION=+